MEKKLLGEEFAFDGCHKIYIIEDEEDKSQAIQCGYNIYNIRALKETYFNSCPLKFISNWKLDTNYLEQFCKNVEFEVEK